MDTKQKIIYAHGGLMIFVWMFSVPVAVGANMYARKTNRTWGPKVHMFVMATAVVLPLTASSIMAFSLSGEIKLRTHHILGSMITLGSWIQVLLGAFNHLLYRYRKSKNLLPDSRPLNNHVHIWFGRILLLMAIVNIPLGIRIKRGPSASYALYGVWLALLVVSFGWLVWLKPEEAKEQHDDEFKKNTNTLDVKEETKQYLKGNVSSNVI